MKKNKEGLRLFYKDVRLSNMKKALYKECLMSMGELVLFQRATPRQHWHCKDKQFSFILQTLIVKSARNSQKGWKSHITPM